jgi:hypothetical protein
MNQNITIPTKICSNPECPDNGIAKPLYEFSLTKINGKMYRRNVCKLCITIQVKKYKKANESKIKKKNQEYNQNNKELISSKKKKYREDNKEFLLQQRKENYQTNKENILSNNKNWRENNKDKLRHSQNKYQRERWNNDPIFKLHKLTSASVRRALKSRGISKNCEEFFDYTPYTDQEMKDHLASQYEWWMTDQNNGPYNPKTRDENDPTTWTWQIDHIIPHSEFHYTSMEDEEFQKCWALSNLRPLCSKQNWEDGIYRKRHKPK